MQFNTLINMKMYVKYISKCEECPDCWEYCSGDYRCSHFRKENFVLGNRKDILTIPKDCPLKNAPKNVCWSCGKKGKIDSEGNILAYGCFFCSPVRLPKSRKH